MVHLRSLAAFAASSASLAFATPLFDSFVLEPRSLFPRVSSCPAGGPASCSNVTAQADLCCFESPGGLLVMTQFWDTNPAVGPDDSWTIHGLWPDNCDGTFKNGCDSSREYPSPKALLEAAGRQDLIDFMTVNWVNNAGGTEDFWKHEWDKHGTCYSTLQPSCLPPNSPTGSEAVLFFNRVVELFKTLPTHQSLASAGIVPSSSETYKLADMQDAIRSSFGKTVGLDCSKNNLQVYYWFNLKGSVIDGELVPIDAPKPGSCKSTGIKYLPKKSSKGARHTKRH